MPDPRIDDDTYEPSNVAANRARQQGSGVGQKDLDAQLDPTRDRSAEQASFTSESETAADSDNAAED